MRVGETVENSYWLTGKESEKELQRITGEIIGSIEEACHEGRVIHGPFRTRYLMPGDERVPDVPSYFDGSGVLLVIEAQIIGQMPRGMSADLDQPSLEQLREVTRRQFAKRFPGQRLTNMECDDIIDEIGEETVVKMVKADRDLH